MDCLHAKLLSLILNHFKVMKESELSLIVSVVSKTASFSYHISLGNNNQFAKAVSFLKPSSKACDIFIHGEFLSAASPGGGGRGTPNCNSLKTYAK